MRIVASCLTAGTLCAGIALAAAGASGQVMPNFAPDASTSWFPDRAAGDDFLPPPGGGPGPVLSDPVHPYVTNDEGRNTGVQPTYRVADLSNPILKPWAIALMKQANDDVLAGKVPYIARERCWPGGVLAAGYSVDGDSGVEDVSGGVVAGGGHSKTR